MVFEESSRYKRGGWALGVLDPHVQVSVGIFTYALRGGVQDRDRPRLSHLVEIPSLAASPPLLLGFAPPFPGSLPLPLPLFIVVLLMFFLLPQYRGTIAGHYGTYVYGIMHLPPTVIIPRYKLHNSVTVSSSISVGPGLNAS